MAFVSLSFISYSENGKNQKDSLNNNNLTPLSSILNEDGTITTGANISGSFNPVGYKLISKPGEAPRFMQDQDQDIRITGDELWENPFDVNSINGTVYAVAVDGTNIYIGGSFLDAGGDPNADYIAKWDGTKWVSMGGVTDGNVYAIRVDPWGNLYAGGAFSLIGGVSANKVAYWDGLNWNNYMSTSVNGGVVRAICEWGGGVIIGGTFTNVNGIPNTNGIARVSWVSNNWVWSSLGTGVNGEVYAIDANSGFVGGSFTTAGGVLANNIAQWDGSNWYTIGNGTNGPVVALASKDTILYLGGYFTMAVGWAGAANSNFIAKYNSYTGVCSDIPGLNGGNVNSIQVSGTDVYVGGNFSDANGVANTSRIAKWNGTSWSALGIGLNAEVKAIAISGSNVIAGGSFTNAGGDVNANNIAKWDGTNWQGLTSGFNNSVHAIAINGSDIYVGGSFTSVAGVTNTSYIARWDGISWHPLGTGTNNSVTAIKIIGSNVYVGGTFTSAGGASNTNYIAVWNGTSWSSMGTGTNGIVSSLESIGTTLYVGGNFGSASGIANTNRIAKWNGSSWSGLSTPLTTSVMGVNNVRCLKAKGSNLYVGGDFDDAGGNINADRIAMWDGTNWNALGSGLYYQLFPGPTIEVDAIEIKDNEVYAGGNFSNVYGNPSFNYIAKWNGAVWSPLGTSPNSGVNSITLKGNSLYVGGMFTIVGGNSNAKYIAKWENNSWSNLGSGTNGMVRVVAADSNYLYAGGTYTQAGDKFAIDFARFGTLPKITTQPLVSQVCVGNSSTIFIHSNGVDPKIFQWNFNGSPIIGETDSVLTISPISLSDQGYYECVVTNPCGSITSDSVYLTVNALPVPVITGNSSYCSGLSTNLSTTVSYSGYTWSTTSGLATINVTSPGNYYVTVTDANGCSNTSAAFNVTENPLPNVGVNAAQNSICLHSSTNIVANGASTYDWSPATGLSGVTGSIVTASPLSTITYTVTGTDGNGCENTANITINVKLPYSNEVICEVNIDTTTNYNFVVWEKTPNVGTSYFKIWKESTFGGVYTAIDSVMYDSMSVYTDVNSNAAIKSDRYKLSIVDTCGNESLPSPAHKTLHLTVNQGMGNVINLIWENYEGIVFGSYYVYRGLTPSSLLPIDTIQNSITTYTDISPSLNNNYYQIVIVNPDSCVATSNAKSQTQTYTNSVSNMEEYKLIGIDENSANMFGLNLFPNPFNNITNIVYTLPQESDVTLTLFNIIGEKVSVLINKKQTQGRNNYNLNSSKINSGIYFLDLNVNGKSQMIKIVKY